MGELAEAGKVGRFTCQLLSSTLGLKMQPKFPKDLAKIVSDQWNTLVVGDYVCPPAPSYSLLRRVLELSYLAAGLPEEGRYPRFNIVMTPNSSIIAPPDV